MILQLVRRDTPVRETDSTQVSEGTHVTVSAVSETQQWLYQA